jgi:hypothetical protein
MLPYSRGTQLWTGVEKGPAIGGAASAGPTTVPGFTGLGLGMEKFAIGAKPGVAGKAQLEFTAGSAPRRMKALTNG